MNFGFVEGLIDATHYVLGRNSKLPNLELQPNGQWDRFLPRYEYQDDDYETSGCTVWGWQNLIETLYRRIYNIEPNYSERFTYIRAGVTLNGASPHEVAECIRKEGLLDAADLPHPQTYQEFRDPRSVTAKMLVKAQNWLVRHSFLHEWLWYEPQTKEARTAILKAALKYSPIGVSVTAWYKGADGTYIDMGLPNNHWCIIYGWQKKGWKVFDSYDHTRKILSFDHNIKIAKRAYIGDAVRQNWLIDLFKRLFT